MTRTWLSAAALVVAAVAAGGCGSKGTTPEGTTNAIVDPAAAFAVRVDAQLTNGRFGRAWQSLHPAQQRILSVSALSNCWRSTGQTELERGLRFEAREVTNQQWQIAGVSAGPRPSRAVRVRVLDGRTREVLDIFTQHVFAVEGEWRWIVSPQVMRAFRNGSCGST